MSEKRKRWSYKISRWFGFPHYHVSLYPAFSDNLEDVFSLKSEVCRHQKFNTSAEADKFIAKVRRALQRRGIELRMLTSDDYWDQVDEEAQE